MGSLVLLNYKDVCPADVLILDTSELINKEAICFTNRESISGETEKALRKACFLTQNGKCPSPNSKMNSFLSFQLDFQRNLEGFPNGYLKLLNDPKTEKVTSENFLEKGERVSTRWVFGVVVCVGKDVRIMREFRRKLYRTSRLERSAEIFFYTYLVIMVVLALFGEIMFRSRSIYNYGEYYNTNMNHLLLYVTILPLDVHYLSELWFLFLKFRLQTKLPDVSLVQQPNLLTNLAHLDYVLIEKTQVLTSKTLEIPLIYFKASHCLYIFQSMDTLANKFEKIQIKSKNSLLVPAGPVSGYTGSPKLNLLESEEVSFPMSAEIRKPKQFIKDFICFPYNFTEAFVSMLSFSSHTRFEGNNWKIGLREEKTIERFAGILGLQATKGLKGNFSIKLNNTEEMQRKTLGFHEEIGVFSSIIIQDSEKDGAWLYAKGKLRDFLTRLDEESKKILDSSILDKFGWKGCLNPVVYARKALDSTELSHFLEKYKNLHSSLINQQEYLSDLFSGLLQEMELITLLAFEENLLPDALDFMNYINGLDINVWMLSGDSMDRVFSAAHRLQVFDCKADRLCIDSPREEDLTSQIKAILNNLSKEIKPLHDSPVTTHSKIHRKTSPPIRLTRNKDLMTIVEERKEKYLLIDGRVVQLIMENNFLFSHFCFIAQIVKTIIGYNFADTNKRDLLDMIKGKFNKKTTVLTVGSGLKDRLMVNSSDISFEVDSDTIKVADVSGKGVSTLVKLIQDSGDIYEKYLNFLEFSYYKSFLFTVGLFIFVFFDEFYSNCLYDPLLTLFFFTGFSVFTQGILLRYYQKIRERLMKDFKELYHEARFRGRNKEILKRLLFMIVETSLIAGLTSLDVFYNGLDFNSLGITLGISMMFFLVVKVRFLLNFN